MDKSHNSYRRLRLGRRDIVERYLAKLETLYDDRKILERAKALQTTILAALQTELFRLFP